MRGVTRILGGGKSGKTFRRTHQISHLGGSSVYMYLWDNYTFTLLQDIALVRHIVTIQTQTAVFISSL